MFRIIGTSIAVCGLLLGAVQVAEAHGTGYYRYDSPGYRHGIVHRDRYMPRWLWRKRGFRHWYARTPLRFDYHMAWWQLYDAYRWERRYDFRRHYRTHYGTRHHDYYRDRRYWRDYEHRERRREQRRRHRDDD